MAHTTDRPGSGRVTLGAVTTTTACVMPVFLVGGLAVQMGAELGFTPAGLGLAVAVYFGASAVTALPAGHLVERLGAAATARAGIALSAACLLAIAVAARNYPLLVALLGAAAAANGLGQLAGNAALSQVGPRRQGLSFGIKQAAIPAATLLAGVAVPTLGLTLGWRWAFAVAAAAAAAAWPLVAPSAPRPRAAGGPSGGTRGGTATVPLVVIGAGAALGAGAASSLGIFLVDSSVDRGISPGLAGLTLTLGSVACIAGRVNAGWLADMRGAHGDVLAVVAQLLLGAVGLALLAAPGTMPLVLGVLLGFGFGWAFPGLVNFAVVQLHPHAPAAATAISQTGIYVGGCLGPLLFGTAAATVGYATTWLYAAGTMLVAAGLMLLARQLLGRRRARPGAREAR